MTHMYITKNISLIAKSGVKFTVQKKYRILKPLWDKVKTSALNLKAKKTIKFVNSVWNLVWKIKKDEIKNSLFLKATWNSSGIKAKPYIRHKYWKNTNETDKLGEIEMCKLQ